MQFILLIVFISTCVAAMAIFRVHRSRRKTLAYWAGLSVLITLPMANAALFLFLLAGSPYFRILSTSGITLIVLGSLALLGALISGVAAMSNTHRPIKSIEAR